MSSLPRRADSPAFSYKSYNLPPVAALTCDFPTDVAQALLPGGSGSELLMSWNEDELTLAARTLLATDEHR
jgi:hypothetical protein